MIYRFPNVFAEGELECPFCGSSANQLINVETSLEENNTLHAVLVFGCGDGCVWNIDFEQPASAERFEETRVTTQVTSTSTRHWEDMIETLSTPENLEHFGDEDIKHHEEMLTRACNFEGVDTESWNFITDGDTGEYQGTMYRRADGMCFVRREDKAVFVPCHEDCGYDYLAHPSLSEGVSIMGAVVDSESEDEEVIGYLARYDGHEGVTALDTDYGFIAGPFSDTAIACQAIGGHARAD